MNKTIVYLDNNATTKVHPLVVDAMLPYFKELYFNPGATYQEANLIKNVLDKSRAAIAKFLGAKDADEIIFTGSATESNNLAIQGALKINSSRKHIITTEVEHPSVYSQCKYLEDQGCEVTYLSVSPDGRLDIKELINAIRPDTAIVSIMLANNETGVVFPVESISRVVKLTDDKIIFHTDATQAVGKMNIALNGSFNYVDMLSLSGHKIYAPKGVGVLYWRKQSERAPLIVGGHQEKGLRAGTENIPYIVALGKAIELIDRNMEKYRNEVGDLRDQLEGFIEANIPDVIINGKNCFRLDNTISVSFKGIEGESIVYALNDHGICVSTGSACSSGDLSLSRVIKSIRLPDEYSHGTIRISLGLDTTDLEIEIVKKVLPRVVETLRKISPFYDL